jgi:uncharacterized protein YaiL (DUF2058 family)
MKKIIIPPYSSVPTIPVDEVKEDDLIIAKRANIIIGVVQVNSAGYYNIVTSHVNDVIESVKGERDIRSFIRLCESKDITLYIQ